MLGLKAAELTFLGDDLLYWQLLAQPPGALAIPQSIAPQNALQRILRHAKQASRHAVDKPAIPYSMIDASQYRMENNAHQAVVRAGYHGGLVRTGTTLPYSVSVTSLLENSSPQSWDSRETMPQTTLSKRSIDQYMTIRSEQLVVDALSKSDMHESHQFERLNNSFTTIALRHNKPPFDGTHYLFYLGNQYALCAHSMHAPNRGSQELSIVIDIWDFCIGDAGKTVARMQGNQTGGIIRVTGQELLNEHDGSHIKTRTFDNMQEANLLDIFSKLSLGSKEISAAISADGEITEAIQRLRNPKLLCLEVQNLPEVSIDLGPLGLAEY